MNRNKLILSVVICLAMIKLIAQTNTLIDIRTDSLSITNSDSISTKIETFSLLDTLKNESILRSFFHPTTKLSGITNSINLTEINSVRDLPFLKQIKTVPPNSGNWKIWFILCLVLYLAVVRLTNSRNFEQASSVVFDMMFLSTIYKLIDSKFTWSSFHLFIIYILSFSLILTQFFEYNQIFNNYSYKFLVWIISITLALIYLVKFVIYFVVGYLLDDVISSTKMIINTIQISNFLGFILLLFSVFYIYTSNLQLTQTIFFTMVAIFFSAILYRLARYLLNQISKSSLPFFYLFIYLCALEISPWLIFIKILNSYLS
jgi:hypothetical protein